MDFARKCGKLISLIGFCSVAFFLALLVLRTGVSAESVQKDKNATRITADKVVYTHDNNQISFTENVYVRTQDFEMECDRLVVYLRETEASEPELKGAGEEKSESGEDKKQQGGNKQSMDINKNVHKVVATENVYISMDNRSAKSDKAVYWRGKSILTLTGKVELQEGPNRIQAETVRLYLDENKSEIVGGNQGQVEALIFPSSNSSEMQQ